MRIPHPQTKGRVLPCLARGCGGEGDPKLLSRDVASCTRYSCADYLDEPPYLTKYVRSRFSGMEGPSGHQSEDSALRTDFFLSSMFEDGDLNLQLLSCQNSSPRPKVCFLGAIGWRLSKRPGVEKVKLLSPRAENSTFPQILPMASLASTRSPTAGAGQPESNPA